MTRLAATVALATLAGLLATARPAAAAPGPAACAALAATGAAPAPKIDRADLRPAAAAEGRTPALPEHCEVFGRLRERPGAYGQAYAVKFHLRLPSLWNGRFFFQGGGGSNGVIGDALGTLPGERPTNALALGYAVVSTDSGHDNALNRDPDRQGVLAFGWDPQARLDYAYAAFAEVARAAKAMVADYYGAPPRYAYFVGCSKGGQEGMAMSQRFPDLFDGVVAGAPGFSLPKAAIAQAWNTQAFARAALALGAKDASGRPLVNRAFSDADLTLASRAIGEACDGLDGARDGLVADFAACTEARVRPALTRIACRGVKTAGCLIGAQIQALVAVHRPARDSSGRPLYASWAWDTGLGGEGPNGPMTGWRDWQLGAYAAERNNSRHVLLGAPSLSANFTTPPTPVRDTPEAYLDYVLGFDFDRDAAKIFATDRTFPVSPWEAMSATSADRTAFKRRGGKIIIYQGVSDPVFSIVDTLDWWKRLDAAERGRADAFVRIFPLPGMGHCRGGATTGRFDAFAALIDWVENGRAPDRLVAEAGPDTPWPGRTRPLCAWPAFAAYSGRGSLERSDSFTCRTDGKIPSSPKRL